MKLWPFETLASLAPQGEAGEGLMTMKTGAWAAALGRLAFSKVDLVSLEFADQSLALLQKSLEFCLLIGDAIGVALFVRRA